MRKKSKFYAGMLSLTAALLGFLFLLVPQVLESLVYYYYLVLGFAHARHSGYGYQWEPPPYGYPGLFFSKIPSLALAGFAVCFLTLGKAEQWKGEYRERSFFVLLATFSVLSWVGLLSVADKQAWRYAMPVLPGVYLVAAIGIDGLSRQFYGLSQYVARFLGSRHGSSSVGTISALLLTVIIGTQLGITSSWYPDYYLFRNSISGGLSVAVERNEVVPTCGLEPLYSFLNSNKVGRRQTFVTVCGDIDLVRYSYERHYPENPGRIEFTPFEGVYGGDYLLVFSAFREKCKPMIKEEDLPRLEEVFSYSRDKVQLSTIYKVTQPDLKDLFTYGIRGAFHQTGFRGHHEVLGDIISAAPHRSIPGYLSFGQHLLLGAGSYEVLFPLLIPASAKGRFDENKVVLRLEVGAEEKYVQFNEINPGEVSFVKMGFVREAERRVQLRTYWFGAVPVSIGSPSIIKRNSPSNDVSSAK
ncbi:MAG: hypothetical protein GX589_03640 [Deltaproteobacteria bacterium]|nr:hypothetical protein [Deltaproteobacteria bacterium]